MLRHFRPDDQDAVRALVLAGLAEHWGGLDESLNTDLDDIAAAYGDGTTLVAEVDGVIVGTGTVRPDESTTWEIMRMSVDAGCRRPGIGRMLAAELIAAARSRGATRIVLETQSTWTDVIAFYRSCGFVVTHTVDGPFGEDTWFELRL